MEFVNERKRTFTTQKRRRDVRWVTSEVIYDVPENKLVIVGVPNEVSIGVEERLKVTRFLDLFNGERFDLWLLYGSLNSLLCSLVCLTKWKRNVKRMNKNWRGLWFSVNDIYPQEIGVRQNDIRYL